MVLNANIDDEVAAALGATARMTLVAPPELQERFLGRAVFQDVEAVMTPTGVILALELEPEEVRAIQKGQTVFLLHFYSNEAITPFRLIFEKAEFEIADTNGQVEGAEESNVIDLRLPESDGSQET